MHLYRLALRYDPYRGLSRQRVIQPLAQHISGIIMPIIRSARPYVIAMVFNTICSVWSLGMHAVCIVCSFLLKTICSNIRSSTP